MPVKKTTTTDYESHDEDADRLFSRDAFKILSKEKINDHSRRMLWRNLMLLGM